VLSINAAISAAVVLASRLHDDLAVFALMLFSVEAFALFPILRRRIQVLPLLTPAMPCLSTHVLDAGDASSCSACCYAIARIGSIGGTITPTLCGRVDERDIRGTCCFDVGTAVQIVSCVFSFTARRITKDDLVARSAVRGTPQHRVDLSGERVAEKMSLCF